jgi:hypothetical protein
MVEVISIITLVTVIITGVAQIIQSYFDYKQTKAMGHVDEVYDYTIQSSCCNFENKN